jgi:hypothetical protein
MSERRFTGVFIPAELWLDKSFSMIEKCILVEIDSLDSTLRHCYASNAHFSKFLGCSVPTVTRAIKKLAQRNLIEVDVENGGDRVIKMMRPPNQNDETPPNQNDEHSILLSLQTSKETSIETTRKPIKHKHGEYQHVLLTTSELDKLKADFPLDWQDRITRLDEYIEMKGAKYKNHNLTIRNWAKRDREKNHGMTEDERVADVLRRAEEIERGMVRA